MSDTAASAGDIEQSGGTINQAGANVIHIDTDRNAFDRLLAILSDMNQKLGRVLEKAETNTKRLDEHEKRIDVVGADVGEIKKVVRMRKRPTAW